jgi:hypothetical protein
MQKWLEDPTFAGLIAVGLTTVWGLLLLDRPRWEARIVKAMEERRVLDPIHDRLYATRPKGDRLYPLFTRLALRQHIRLRSVRLAKRSVILLHLEDRVKSESYALARSWIRSVGAFAQEVSELNVPLRSFLQTNHLAVVRDGVIAMTIVLAMTLEDLLDDEEFEAAMWGIALVELAARYNALAPQQRQTIYAEIKPRGTVFGPLVRAPSFWKIPVLSLTNALRSELRLREGDRRKAGRTFDRARVHAMKDFREEEREGSVPAAEST